MHHEAYDRMVKFASEGELEEEIIKARSEYVQRTGDLFESDPSYERRLGSFLEWYVLDRPLSFAAHRTPAKMYIDDALNELTTQEVTELRALTKTVLSLFQYKGVRGEKMKVVDLLSNKKVEVYERRKPSGLESGDILEARLVPNGDQMMLSEVIGFHPREVRKTILKVAKRFRKIKDNGTSRVDLVHKVAYFSNRCERYSHVSPTEIFSELQ